MLLLCWWNPELGESREIALCASAAVLGSFFSAVAGCPECGRPR